LSDQRQSAPEPRNEVDLPETFKRELHGTPVILDIRNLAKRATNLVYLVRVAIGQRCQAPTGVRDWLSALRRSHRNWKCLLSLKWNCFESEGHPATPDAVVRVLSQGSQAEALRVFSDQILPSFISSISSAWGTKFRTPRRCSRSSASGPRRPACHSCAVLLSFWEVVLAYEQCVSKSRARASSPAGQA